MMLMANKSKHALGVSMFALAMMISGPSVVAVKIAVDEIHPLILGAIRSIVVGLLVALVAYFLKHRPRFLLRKLWFPSILYAVNMAFFVFALEKTSALVIAISVLLVPIFVYIGAVTYLKEYRSNRALLGSLVGLAGAVLLVVFPLFSSGDSGESTSTTLLGNLFALGAAISYSAVILTSKRLQMQYDVYSIIANRFVAGGVLLLVTGLAVGETIPTSLSSDVAYSMIYYVIIGGVLLNMLLFKALDYMKAEDSSSLIYLDTLSGAAAAVILLDESLNTAGIIGASIIVAGVFIAHPVHIHAWLHHHSSHKRPRLSKIRHLLRV